MLMMDWLLVLNWINELVMFNDVITEVRFEEKGSQIMRVRLYVECGVYFVLSEKAYDGILKTLGKESLVGQEVRTNGDWMPCFNCGGFVVELIVGECSYKCIATDDHLQEIHNERVEKYGKRE